MVDEEFASVFARVCTRFAGMRVDLFALNPKRLLQTPIQNQLSIKGD